MTPDLRHLPPALLEMLFTEGTVFNGKDTKLKKLKNTISSVGVGTSGQEYVTNTRSYLDDEKRLLAVAQSGQIH